MRRRNPAAPAVDLDSDQLTAPIRALLDDMLEWYVDWRERALLTRMAYTRWCEASASERRLRFAGYLAALDQEESTAAAYAAIVREVTRRVLT